MLQAQAENVWTVDHQLALPGGTPFPARMTVIRLPDASLALISAVPIDDVLAAELAVVGPVAYVIAPNLLHHLFVSGAAARYPAARVLGPAGLERKQPSLKFEALEPERYPSLGEAVAARRIEGAPRISESVLFHRPSRSLIVTDLVFNIEQPPAFRTSVLLWLTGSRGRLAQSRIWSFLREDAKRARESSEHLFDWDFERLIVAHGDVVTSDARSRLRSALTRTGPVPARAPLGA